MQKYTTDETLFSVLAGFEAGRYRVLKNVPKEAKQIDDYFWSLSFRQELLETMYRNAHAVPLVVWRTEKEFPSFLNVVASEDKKSYILRGHRRIRVLHEAFTLQSGAEMFFDLDTQTFEVEDGERRLPLWVRDGGKDLRKVQRQRFGSDKELLDKSDAFVSTMVKSTLPVITLDTEDVEAVKAVLRPFGCFYHWDNLVADGPKEGNGAYPHQLDKVLG